MSCYFLKYRSKTLGIWGGWKNHLTNGARTIFYDQATAQGNCPHGGTFTKYQCETEAVTCPEVENPLGYDPTTEGGGGSQTQEQTKYLYIIGAVVVLVLLFIIMKPKKNK